MILKEVEARDILNSRKERTIQVIVKTSNGSFKSAAPSGASKGEYEARPYAKTLKSDKTVSDRLKSDIGFINKLNIKDLNKAKICEFKDLKEVEGLVSGKIGANSLFVLEASILKALAAESGKELYEFLSRGKPKKFPFPVGNAIGGGMHSFSKKPDFQEFLFIAKSRKFSDRVDLNKKAYKLAGKILKAKKTSDEGAWYTSLDNEKVLDIMQEVKDDLGKEINLGLDIAASTFLKKTYNYKNKKQKLNRLGQIDYISKLAQKYELFYIEDPLDEEDFEGFAEINKRIRGMIVGDDLTVTNLMRVKKAVQKRAIDALIVKPNQNGSLLKVKEIMDFCKKNNIKTIISHRSGETSDDTIADLSVAWKADFIKTGIYGYEREAKLKRLVEIEKKSY